MADQQLPSQQLANIERSLGDVQGTLNALVREIDRDRQDAQESRSRIYLRVEHAEKTTVTAGQIATQARDEVQELRKTVYEDVKPQTDRLKSIGLRGSGFLAAAVLLGGLTQPAFASVLDAISKFFKGN